MIKKSELRLLQEQIKPHFLYNTIESILSLIHLGLFDKAAETTMKMGNFYRIALSTGHFMITLEEEIKLTESYLYIQKNRYVEYMDYEIICEKDVPDFLIPKLTLQPLVENAIYHGLRKKHAMGMVKVEIRNESGMILIEVYDNGAGMELEKVSELMHNSETDSKSFGISSVRKRLEFVYGEGFQFTIHSEAGVYSLIRLSLDCKVLKGEAVND
jgi:sensor histidine kinase YesM